MNTLNRRGVARLLTRTGKLTPAYWMAAYLCAALVVGGGFGCGDRKAPPPSPTSETANGDAAGDALSAGPPLRLLVVDDPSLAAVIEREWLAHAQQPIALQLQSSAQLMHAPIEADVVVFPSPLLGQLIVTRQIVPFPRQAKDGDALDALFDSAGSLDPDGNDLFPWLRRHELSWNDERYGVSLGSPQLLLAVRQDLLDNWQLKMPRSWDEYQTLLDEIERRVADEKPVGWQSATIEPLAPGWAGATLLARAASYARHPSQYSTLFQFTTMTPLIDRAPFVRALTELQVAISQPAASLSASPSECMQALLRGETALALTWPSAARPALGNQATAGQFGLCVLPGSSEVYLSSAQAWEPRAGGQPVSVPLFGSSGRIGAIARRAQSVAAASNFLLWLAQAEQARHWAKHSDAITLSRPSQLASARDWMEPEFAAAADQYGEILLANQQQPTPLTMLRIPGQAEYLAALDEAVRLAIRDGRDPQAALSAVAAQWQQITQRLGLEAQRTAYLQSLGLQVP